MITPGISRCDPLQSLPSFLSGPIAPLNIAPKSFSPALLNIPRSPSSTSAFRRPSFASQSMLEANVRYLCDMVDNVLRTNTEQESKPLRIQVHQPDNCSNINTPTTEHCRDPKSPLFLLSPRTFTMAKNDISRVDDGVVSKINRDTLLNMFPTPPQALPRTESPETVPSFPTQDSHSHQRMAGKNRNWVITSALFFSPPKKSATCEDQEACHPLSPRSPFSPPEPLFARRSLRQKAKDMPAAAAPPSLTITAHPGVDHTKHPLSSTPHTLSPAMSPASPNALSPMDALSQHLWNIESQMRRPSFLMNRRTSILSTLFVSNAVAPLVSVAPVEPVVPVAKKPDQQERLRPELSLTVGNVAMPEVASPLPTIAAKVNAPEQFHNVQEQDVDWHAWHGAWTRRRMKLEDKDVLLSPTSPPPRSSCSSTASEYVTACSSPCTPSTPIYAKKESSQFFQKTRKFRKFYTPSSSSPLSSPVTPSPNPHSPTEDANPEIWASESPKWGDRFQSLVQNFQASAGKHSRKLAEILPKSRWTRQSRSRSSSSEYGRVVNLKA
ncbi:hypothetical protein BG011_006248 [Mortierella polycephala]|uniref:Uncharacterized protein n=1 Tax=Mortierella polycephala TaxID=41804 RepID=A0A9P6PWK7_9FUNG|nr:hypothetical protein BG011_006248 [Mortierella polycephala]